MSCEFKNHVFLVCVRHTHVLSVSKLTILLFLARIIFLSAVYSLLEIFCPVFSWILDSIISLILSRTFHPKASTSLCIVLASQFDFTLNFEFFSENPDLVSVKYTLFCIFRKKSFKYKKTLFLFSNFHLGINFVPKDRTLIVDKLGLKLFDRLCSPTGITLFFVDI